VHTHRQTGGPAPKSDYERFNCNNFSIRYWSWNYRGCHYLPVSGFGQFTRLLPSLDVVAISQAPSPESNPNSPLPVNAMVGLYPTIES
jgi:hypothetical protein